MTTPALRPKRATPTSGRKKSPDHAAPSSIGTACRLVTGVDTFEIHIDRAAWELDAGNERLAVEELARLLGVEEQTILAIVGSGGGRDVLLALNVPFALGESITLEGLPGVKVTPASLRRYAEGGLASQLLGFVGRDNQGLSGVEFDFDAILAGSPGLLVFERDSIGNPIPFGAQAQEPTQPGGDLVLTIDKGLQRIAEKHLAQALEDTGGPRGHDPDHGPQHGRHPGHGLRPHIQRQRAQPGGPQP